MDVNVHEAKTHLSRLLKKVEEGEEITISRAGMPVAKLVAADSRGESRPMGMDAGKLYMAGDFDDYGSELEALFYQPVTTPMAPRTTPKRLGSKAKKKRS